ncbi:ribose-phosphate diphosphokinase [Sneathiella limimaris]|uniref:ribose-phosphate diphosphokinase n=1 Tax=Sneathiella limimaris TaxID=1964213 RepID=UPI00146F878C|nr:ribose-phosphate diphosphokinase [Sneathiella limimaris]
MTKSAAEKSTVPVIFALEPHPLQAALAQQLNAVSGKLEIRSFPDKETYLRVETAIKGRPCIVIADLTNPNEKYLPLVFLLETLRELGATSVGLVAPYLSYMRQDCRFRIGEAITSRIFAKNMSLHIDWLVTIDPHLHRYNSLDEIYTVPSRVIQGAPALVGWLKTHQKLVLIGPDEESEQWVSEIAQLSGHPYVIGEKQRFGDREVTVTLPDLKTYQSYTAVIIDDIISSGQTILRCVDEVKKHTINHILCIAVHGIFADNSDAKLLSSGIETLVTTNTIRHSSNAIDIAPLLVEPISDCISQFASEGSHSRD